MDSGFPQGACGRDVGYKEDTYNGEGVWGGIWTLGPPRHYGIRLDHPVTTSHPVFFVFLLFTMVFSCFLVFFF